MGKTAITKLLAVAAVALSFVSCEDKPFEDLRSEYYARNFIKEFGVPDPEHDWNMATEGTVTLNVGDSPADVTIHAKYGDRYYLVADLENIKGQFDVPFDVPKECKELMVTVNGAKFYGNIGGKIDCSNHPARQPKMSRVNDENEDDEYTQDYTYRVDKPFHRIKRKGVTIITSEPTTNPYIYFNAQQMAPILQKTEWADYWSMSDGTKKVNANHKLGILPESSSPNRGMKKFNLPYDDGNAYEHPEVTQDFVYQLVDPMKGFDIYPMFYGSNLQHTLGIYLLDDKLEPIRDANNNIIKYPIYQSKHGDDIQLKEAVVSEPTEESGEIGIRDAEGNLIRKGGSSGGFEITIYKGEPYHITLDFGGEDPGTFSVKTQDENGIYFTDENGTGLGNGKYQENQRDFYVRCDNTTTNWCRLYVKIDGAEYANENGEDIPLVVKVIERPVKRIEIWDGNTQITNTSGEGISVPEGQSKTLVAKCYDAESGGTLVTNKTNLKVGDWHKGIFTIAGSDGSNTKTLTYDSTVGGYPFTINGVSASATETSGGNTYTGHQWTVAFVDLDGNNSGDDNEPATSLKVTVTGSTTHTFTKTFDQSVDATEIPGEISANWSSYFETGNTLQPVSGYTTQYSKPRRAAGDEVDYMIWEGSRTLEWNDNNKFDYNTYLASLAPFTDYTKLKVTFSSKGNIKIVTLDNNNGDWKQHEEKNVESGDTYTWDLTDEFKTRLSNQYSLSLQGTMTITGVYLVGPSSTNPGNWLPGGRANAKAALVNYYKGLNQNFTCNADGHNNDGYVLNPYTDKDVKVSVTIPDDASLYNIKYTLTLSKTVASSNAPRKGGPKGTIYKGPQGGSKKTSNRADNAEYIALTTGDGPLNKDNVIQWHQIRYHYDDVAKTTDAYDFKKCQLVRSKGYHVDLKFTDEKGNEQYWYGYFGMYIDYDWLPESYYNYNESNGLIYKGPDGSVNTEKDNAGGWKPGDWGRPKSGTHYSQAVRNILTYNGVDYPISYAATFTHPMSTNQYLCFEDWAVTKPVGDYSLNNEPGSATFKGWDWTEKDASKKGDYSSDRDLNDIIYRQVGLIPTRTTEIHNVDKGFTWIWALEDLGSTDDFDFNDVVIRISSVTTNQTIKDGDKTDTKITKNVKFTPLAAGGTLPLYIHFKYSDTQDYILNPGVFDFTTAEHPGEPVRLQGPKDLSSDHGFEYHEWFNVSNYRVMINTNASNGRDNLTAATCELIVPSEFTLNNKQLPMVTDNSTTHPETMDAKGFQFYVTVNAPTAKTEAERGEQIDAARLGDAYRVSIPAKGAVAQSFLIVETKTTKEDNKAPVTTNYARPWVWPKERAHILDAYPDFNKWVKDSKNNDWYKNSKPEYLYKGR